MHKDAQRRCNGRDIMEFSLSGPRMFSDVLNRKIGVSFDAYTYLFRGWTKP
jgi:hypothetical protein